MKETIERKVCGYSVEMSENEDVIEFIYSNGERLKLTFEHDVFLDFCQAIESLRIFCVDSDYLMKSNKN